MDIIFNRFLIYLFILIPRYKPQERAACVDHGVQRTLFIPLREMTAPPGPSDYTQHFIQPITGNDSTSRSLRLHTALYSSHYGQLQHLQVPQTIHSTLFIPLRAITAPPGPSDYTQHFIHPITGNDSTSRSLRLHSTLFIPLRAMTAPPGPSDYTALYSSHYGK